MIEIKCLNCGTWNKDKHFCSNCNQAISQKEIVKKEIALKKIEEENKPPSKTQIISSKLKNHKYFLVRVFYKILYSIGLVFAAIGAFLAWMVAVSNG